MARITSLVFLAVACLLSIANAYGAASGMNARNPKVSVIELYTSQGCSSCPEADQLLKRLAQRPELIVLTFPVNYWDYLGWKDTLAQPENAQRQRGYSKNLSDGQVFTPQAIVNGMQICLGNSLADIESAVKATEPLVAANAVEMSARIERDRLIIDAGEAPQGSSHRRGRVFVAAVQSSYTVKVMRGENAGKPLSYTNVVRRLTEVGEWDGAPVSYAIPLDKATKLGDSLVVFLQTGDFGPIVGATRVASGS